MHIIVSIPYIHIYITNKGAHTQTIISIYPQLEIHIHTDLQWKTSSGVLQLPILKVMLKKHCLSLWSGYGKHNEKSPILSTLVMAGQLQMFH